MNISAKNWKILKKPVICKICGGPHYKTFCFNAPKKPIVSKTTNYTSLATKRLRTPVSHRKQLILALDKIFSIYIRLRHSKDGQCRCVTCGRVDHWKKMHCGHYISRGKVGTRWSVINCNVQCVDCNIRLRGNLEVYKTWLQVNYGIDIIEQLQNESRKQIATVELSALIDYYSKKVLTLKE